MDQSRQGKVRAPRLPALTAQPPPQHPAQSQHLQHRDREQLRTKRLLAGLVPKQRPPGISPRRAAEQGEGEQSGFSDAPVAALGVRLVDPECRKGDKVDRDQGGGEVGWGEEVEHIVKCLCALRYPVSRYDQHAEEDLSAHHQWA